MALDLTNINAALTRTGSEPITSLDEGSSGARIAKENYEGVVKAALTHPFHFARKFQALNLLDMGEALPPWLYAYQQPTDLLELRAVEANGAPIEYTTMNDKVFCNSGPEAPVFAIYTYRPPEAKWSPLFAEAIVQHMEALFLGGIGERHAESERKMRAAEMMMQRAKTRDAQSRKSPRNPFASELLRVRRG
jgi:hypothetical protein